jgi:hypothetical protein
MTGTNCDLFTHNQSRSYLNHLVLLNNFNKLRINVKFLLCLIKLYNLKANGDAEVQLQAVLCFASDGDQQWA